MNVGVRVGGLVVVISQAGVFGGRKWRVFLATFWMWGALGNEHKVGPAVMELEGGVSVGVGGGWGLFAACWVQGEHGKNGGLVMVISQAGVFRRAEMAGFSCDVLDVGGTGE